MSDKKVGLIGLGIMGESMARNLLKGGFEVTVYNRSEGPAKKLESEGATRALSPHDIGESVDIAILSVSNGAVVEEVLFGKDGVAGSKARVSLVIDMSTIAPSLTRDIAKRLRASRY